MDQHADVLTVSYHINLFVPDSIGVIWHLSKMLEEAAS
jgi:hypothetical protein